MKRPLYRTVMAAYVIGLFSSMARPIASLDSGAVPTAFINVSVIPMDRERVLRNQTVLVARGQITAMGPVAHVVVPANTRRIDGQGKFLIPGLGDMHVHVEFGDSARTERELLRLLATGVTTVRDMDFRPAPREEGERFLRQRARAATGELLSPRIYASGPWNGKGKTQERSRTIAEILPKYQAMGYDFVKVHDEDTLTYDSLVAVAHRINLPIAGHLPAGIGIERALHDRYISIEHLYGYPHYIYAAIPKPKRDALFASVNTAMFPAATAIAVTTRRAGVWNCPTQAINERVAAAHFQVDTGLESEEAAALQPLLVLFSRRIIKALQDAGAGLLLGTDHNPTLTLPDSAKTPWTISVHEELAALVRAGLTPYQALTTGTRNVATFLGTTAMTGTIAVNKRADLVLLDGNPLDDIANTARLSGIVIGGRWLSRHELDARIAELPPDFPEAQSSRPQ